MKFHETTLTKVAKTAYVKMLERAAKAQDEEKFKRLGKTLSSAMQSGKIRSRESTIKNLGQGSTNIADLVHNPQLGGVVRKLGNPDGLSGGVDELAKHLGEKKYKQFTAYLGERPSLIGQRKARYWEAAFGPQPEVRFPSGKTRNLSKLHGRYENLAHQIQKLEDLPRDKQLPGRLERLRRLYRAKGLIGGALMKDVTKTQAPAIHKDVAAIEDRLGKGKILKNEIWDIRPTNVVGGRVVDAEMGLPAIFRQKVSDDVKGAHKSLKGNLTGDIKLTHIGKSVAKDHPIPTAATSAPSVRVGWRPPNKPSRLKRAFDWMKTNPGKTTGIALGVAGLGYLGYRAWKKRQQEKEKQEAHSNRRMKKVAMATLPHDVTNVWNAMDSAMPGHGPTDWAMTWGHHGARKARTIFDFLKARFQKRV